MDEIDFAEQASEFIEVWEDIKRRTGDEAVALGVLQEFAKDHRLKSIQRERWLRREGGPATQRQLDYLKLLGIKADQKLTRRRASELIEDALRYREGQEAKKETPRPHIEYAPTRVP